MKKLSLVFSCLAALFINSFSLTATVDDPLPIPIPLQQVGEGTNIYRGPESYPFSCFLYDTEIEVSFSQNLGTVSVEIDNMTTGEHSQTTLNAIVGQQYLPISGSIGSWGIIFSLPDGTQFYGLFSIQ